MRKQTGFTLIEVIVFIVVTGIVMSTLLLSAINVLRNVPNTHNQIVALQTATQCMEWYLDQRRMISYASLTCPSAPSATACSAPSGYTVSTSISCTTWNSDVNYKTITVNVSGLANASLSTMIGNY